MFVDQIFAAFTSQLEFFSKIKISSIKVTTNQVAIAAKMQIQAAQKIDSAETSALALLESSKAQMKVFQDFSPQTGQGANPCYQMQVQKAAVAAATFVQGTSQEYLKKVKVVGRSGNNESHAKQLLKEKLENFATADDEKLGYAPKASAITDSEGNVIELGGADANAATLFVPSDDPRVKLAKTNYIKNATGAPDAPITKLQASSGAGAQALQEKTRKDAVMSVGQHSLAMVAAENDPDHELGDQSMIQTSKNVVKVYFGALAALTHQAWVSQSERGLMVDSLKISGATLAAEVNLLEQAMRQEALVATLASLHTQTLKAESDAKAMALTERLHQSPVK